jgi:cytochrome c oxidase subunit I+III
MATVSTTPEIIEQPDTAAKPYEGLWSWLATTDHKRIGVLYLLFSGLFFVMGGFEALLIRAQLAVPNNHVLSPRVYDQIFTMHGVTMIFLVIMPLFLGFANFIVPLQIGYRDMAFPRLNAMSVWLFLFGGLLLYFSLLEGAMPDVGWFAYAPLTEKPWAADAGPTFWAAGLTVSGIGTVATALNLIVTIIAHRCPGMTLRKMPPFTWMSLVTGFLIIWAFPYLTAVQVMLLLDRFLNAHFFVGPQSNAILYEHLFWSFGHPEVYILILPGFGIISEIIPVFSRKPIFGYTFVIMAGVAIAFISFTVWAHHMFTVGMGPAADAFFAASTMVIAVPTGVKILNWLATMWGGKIRWTTAMKFAAAFIPMFVIGGLSGVMFATVPIDYQTTDTYFVVAHLHYVLFGGSMFIILAAVYYWFPKITGRMLSERVGNVVFWLTLLGFNLTFLPMHLLAAMPRRIYTYAANSGWGPINFAESIGAGILLVAFTLFIWDIIYSLRRGKEAGPNPWEAWTLEWATASPPPPYNFEEIPAVRSRRPLWDEAHPENPDWIHEDNITIPPGVSPAVVAPPIPSVTPSMSPIRLGMILFITSEFIFFASLMVMFAAYAFHFTFQVVKPHDVWFMAIFSVCLWASSITFIIAEHFLRVGKKALYHRWLVITIALGLAFEGATAFEYKDLFDKAISISTGTEGTTFFGLTGFHALHVAIGLTALAVILALSRHWSVKRHLPVTVVGYYWHFVDWIWVIIFSLAYVRTLFPA